MVESHVNPEIDTSAVFDLFIADRRYRLSPSTIAADEWAASRLPAGWPATHELQAVLATSAAHLADRSKKTLVDGWQILFGWAAAIVAIDRSGMPVRIYSPAPGLDQITPGLTRLPDPTLHLPRC